LLRHDDRDMTDCVGEKYSVHSLLPRSSKDRQIAETILV